MLDADVIDKYGPSPVGTVASLLKKVCIFVTLCFWFVVLYLGVAVRRTPFFLRHVCCGVRLVAFVACMWGASYGGLCTRMHTVGCRLSSPLLLLLLFALSFSLSLSLLFFFALVGPQPLRASLMTQTPLGRGYRVPRLLDGVGGGDVGDQGYGLYAVGCCWRWLLGPLIGIFPFLSHYPVRGFGLYAVGCCLDLPPCESLSGFDSLSVLAL